MADSKERTFQDGIIAQLQSIGWLVGDSKNYDRERALYPEDLIAFYQNAYPKEWEKFCKHNPQDSEQKLLNRVVKILETDGENGGTLSVLRHQHKEISAKLRFCQFKSPHSMTPETQERYKLNRLRVVPEVTYSPHNEKSGRIDLVLFVNGVPVATIELKSDFQQSVYNAINQYKKDRQPKDPQTKKPEPLLTFKRGALVHFAVSRLEVHMATQLKGMSTRFLPFNRGNNGGSGNPSVQDKDDTHYLWEEVLDPDNWLHILGKFMHLQVEEKETPQGKKYKTETMIFPRYHQWDCVRKLVSTIEHEGTGSRYLVQHSAGSGKSNTIAWTAHQLSNLHNENNERVFDSVIVITDRTVLDNQLQETIYQFEHAAGVVERITRDEGQGSKSEKLTKALINGKDIIIVTIQTFPFVLEAIQKNTTLQGKRYAIIADEAHSSQTGAQAKKVKQVLTSAQDEEGIQKSAEDVIDEVLETNKQTSNLSYFAFTATPKGKTLELFGRCPNPDLPPSDDNKPRAFHLYTMKQAIEEGFILDVLENYTNYKLAYELAHKNPANDKEVDTKKAKTKIAKWVRLHPHNIAQKVEIIIEHFRHNVMLLLEGQAKAMVVTSSRIEAVRYKLAFDKYIKNANYPNIQAMVAFSGEVVDPESGTEPYRETSKIMNPNLKGRDMRKAFDTDEYQVMIVANKFQTGFDQPKLCAMYVDKKFAGVDCVQTLSRLNRTYSGKTKVYVLDFVNDPEEIQEAFLPFYESTELSKVSDPNLVHKIMGKLTAKQIFYWQEVEDFASIYFDPKGKPEHLMQYCKPAVDRFKDLYKDIASQIFDVKQALKVAKEQGNDTGVHNAESDLKHLKEKKDELDTFKKDLSGFVRLYEFMSQVVDYDDADLEKFKEYAKHLQPLLKIENLDDDIDLSDVFMTYYRLSKQEEQQIVLEGEGDGENDKVSGITSLGSRPGREEKVDFLKHIIEQLNELFTAEHWTDKDKLNFLYTIADKISENQETMDQIRNNTEEQALLGDFPKNAQDAVIDSMTVHEELANEYLSNDQVEKGMMMLLYSMLKKKVSKASASVPSQT